MSLITELQTREASFQRGLVDVAARTVPVSLSSEEPVSRYGESEVLRHDAQAVDLSRAAGGLPLLFAHDTKQPVGVVENVRLDGRRLVGLARFGQSAKAQEVFQDIQDGVLRGMSIGYWVLTTERFTGGYTATQWMPYEASVVAVPADNSVGVGRSAETTTTPEGNNMPSIITNGAPALQNRAADPADVRELGKRHGMEQGFINGLIQRGLSQDEVRAAVLEELAACDRRSGGHLNVVGGRSYHGVSLQAIDVEHRAAAGSAGALADMESALAARIGGPAADAANQYRHARISDMARDLLELRGIRTTAMGPRDLIERALHTTSDFSNLLQGAGNRLLRMGYAVAPGIKRVFRASTASDFRAKSRLNLSEAPQLLKVNEAGEFKSGSMVETASSYSLATFGRIFGISRQALLNDDLDAFGSMSLKLGRAAAEFENQFLVDLLTGNPAMYDGAALFHANHGNVATGAGSALQLNALTAARQAMRLQKGLDGKTPIDATPSFLIVPAALETTAEQLVAQITPNQTASVNPFAGRLEVVVDPRLDAVSATAWYLAADSSVIDTIEYSYLESEQGPQMFAQDGFEVDGVQLKVRLDFGAGVIDWRGMYRGAGA